MKDAELYQYLDELVAAEPPRKVLQVLANLAFNRYVTTGTLETAPVPADANRISDLPR
jgi:hypothetical protein